MMKAVRIEAPGAVALVEIAAPLPAPGEVRLRLTHVGFCGSDLSSYQGRNPMVSFPRVPAMRSPPSSTSSGPASPIWSRDKA